jgi:hypothetical protein
MWLGHFISGILECKSTPRHIGNSGSRYIVPTSSAALCQFTHQPVSHSYATHVAPYSPAIRLTRPRCMIPWPMSPHHRTCPYSRNHLVRVSDVLKRALHRAIPRYRSASAPVQRTGLAGLWGLLDVCDKVMTCGMEAGWECAMTYRYC